MIVDLKVEILEDLILKLKERFEKNKDRHPNIKWDDIQNKLEIDKKLLKTVRDIEGTGGEIDVFESKIFDGPVFLDFASESPKGRRSLCYDKEARINRKKNAPESSVIEEASKMGIKVLNEDQYYALQENWDFDLKSSSWILTDKGIRDLGGALFCQKRYKRTFTSHNGADSYYSSRGFRAYVEIDL